MAFRLYRDNMATTDPDVEARRAHMDDVLQTLGRRIDRQGLYLAWDFTVASEHSLAGRALAIRDDSLHELGDDTPGDSSIDGHAPTFHITSVENNPANLPANTLRQIDGGNGYPLLPQRPGLPPGRDVQLPVKRGRERDPDRNGGRPGCSHHRCTIPLPDPELGVRRDVHPTQSGIFGHGLLGDFTQVSDMIKFSNSEANISNTTWCATNWAGFSSDDIGTVLGARRSLELRSSPTGCSRAS